MEFSSFPLFYKENLRTRPQDFIVNDATVAQVEQTAKKMRAERDAAAPPPGKADLHKEYNQLRQKLFDLRQDAKTFEQRTNDADGNVRLLEQRINDVLKEKKSAVAENNLRGERTYEQTIQRLEVELVDAQEEFEKNKRWSVQAARALRAFDGHARIAELKKQIDEGLPDVKSVNVPK
jgi:chromosome segregation ATPase